MNLRHISRGLLVMFAGGDPWKVYATLQSGKPAQISDLAQAFHDAGQSTQEADNAFADARRRIQAWIQDNAQHPITDSAQVQRTAAALGLQAAQLPRIGVDMENIAAALAQAQGTANAWIASLEAQLQTLDAWIGWAEDAIKQDEELIAHSDDEDDIADLQGEISDLQDDITGWEQDAVDDTKETLQQVEQVREDYDTIKLTISADTVLKDSYTAAEIRYLQGRGYKIIDGYTLVPPKIGGRP